MFKRVRKFLYFTIFLLLPLFLNSCATPIQTAATLGFVAIDVAQLNSTAKRLDALYDNLVTIIESAAMTEKQRDELRILKDVIDDFRVAYTEVFERATVTTDNRYLVSVENLLRAYEPARQAYVVGRDIVEDLEFDEPDKQQLDDFDALAVQLDASAQRLRSAGPIDATKFAANMLLLINSGIDLVSGVKG